jgi:hypothetical protein
MTIPETVDPLTGQWRDFRERLLEHERLLPSQAAVLPGLGPKAVAFYDAQSACTGFGLERIVLALANHHGLDLNLDAWPRNVRTLVGIEA